MLESVLVTGGAGFIGKSVCNELLERGYRVRVLDSLVEQVHGAGALAARRGEVVQEGSSGARRGLTLASPRRYTSCRSRAGVAQW